MVNTISRLSAANRTGYGGRVLKPSLLCVRPTEECNKLKKTVQPTYSRSDTLTFLCIRCTTASNLYSCASGPSGAYWSCASYLQIFCIWSLQKSVGKLCNRPTIGRIQLYLFLMKYVSDLAVHRTNSQGGAAGPLHPWRIHGRPPPRFQITLMQNRKTI